MPPLLRVGLLAVAVVVVGFLLIKSISPTPSSPSTASAPQPGTPPIGATVPLPAELIAPPVDTPPADTQWSPVFSATGSDTQRTESFTLSGNTVRIRYNLQLVGENQAGIFTAYVQPEGQTGGQVSFPDLFLGAPSEGEQLFNKPAGTYVLNVQSFGCSWTLDIEEAA